MIAWRPAAQLGPRRQKVFAIGFNKTGGRYTPPGDKGARSSGATPERSAAPRDVV